MLERWTLEGFKSFAERTTLEMAPITVFAGANSSGKSTIIQSILLLKQTVQYGSSDRALALNGPLIRLGTFDDIIHFDSKQRALSIEFSFRLKHNTSKPEGASWLNKVVGDYGLLSLSPKAAVEGIFGSFLWEPRRLHEGNKKDAYDKLRSVLTRGTLEVTRTSEESEASITSSATYRFVNKLTSAGDDSRPILWDSKLDGASLAEITRDKPDPKLVGIMLEFFLPEWMVVEYDEAKKRARNIADSICASSLMTSGTIFDFGSPNEELAPPVVTTLVNNWLTEAGEVPIPVPEEGVTLRTLKEHLRPFQKSVFSNILSIPQTTHTQTNISALRERIEQALTVEFGKNLQITAEKPRLLRAGTEFVIEFFKYGVRYLGPLRDEPKPVYPPEALENTTDIGYTGEHTAAVLHQHRDKVVSYIRPEAFEKGSPTDQLHLAKLRNAVVEWLQYLGVATDVYAGDAGVFGNTLQVKTEGLGQRIDLTNVGVGVSQLLPIVVSALLAPPTSLLIYEQPELHLHPRVQARLADFFYAMALSGKQCVLETHSEYMIDRFRRRIAEEEFSRLNRMLAIYFTERVNGETRCRKVEVTRYGAVIDWPKDFFEQSQFEAKRIIEAASSKRLKEKNKG